MICESSMGDSEPTVVTTQAALDQFPDWKAQSLVYDSGEVFMPAAVFLGTDERGAMMSMFDGAPFVLRGGHVYVESDWLADHASESGLGDQIRQAASKCRHAATSR